MPRKNKSTTVVFTKQAQKAVNNLSPVFGLKSVVSAGVLLFQKLSDSEQKKIVAEVNSDEIIAPSLTAKEAIEEFAETISTMNGSTVKVLDERQQALVAKIRELVGPENTNNAIAESLATHRRSRGRPRSVNSSASA